MLYGWDTADLFGELRRMQSEMDRLFHRVGSTTGTSGVFPLANIYDDGEVYHIRAELPGVDRNTLNVTVTGDQITITGERKPEIPEEASYHRRERDHGAFSRAIKLPAVMNADGVKALYKNGVLDVLVPRAEEAKPRKVAVEG
ncbi:MAG: Hsp20/alpha crystallin family protein [Deltaproteobacteria bacterium]|nr:Hsp20/alpha crystallin family protein [Deltaproteobacteria bacterium]